MKKIKNVFLIILALISFVSFGEVCSAINAPANIEVSNYEMLKQKDYTQVSSIGDEAQFGFLWLHSPSEPKINLYCIQSFKDVPPVSAATKYRLANVYTLTNDDVKRISQNGNSLDAFKDKNLEYFYYKGTEAFIPAVTAEQERTLAYILQNSTNQNTAAGKLQYTKVQYAIYLYLYPNFLTDDNVIAGRKINYLDYATLTQEQKNKSIFSNSFFSDVIQMINIAKVNASAGLTLDKSNYTLNLDSTKRYFVTDEITVPGTSFDETTMSLVNASSNTVVVKLNNGKEEVIDKSNLKALGGSKIIIKVPVEEVYQSGEISMQLKFTTKKKKVAFYRTDEDPDNEYAKQDLITVFDDSVDTTLTVELSGKVPVVLIKKINSETKQPLKGAELVIKNSKGEVEHRFVTTENPEQFVVQLQRDGNNYIFPDYNETYYLSEEKAPEGFQLSDEVIEFKFKIDGDQTKIIEFYNEKAQENPKTGISSYTSLVLSITLASILGLIILKRNNLLRNFN